MKRAEILTGKDGARCLIVYYSMALGNYDEAIADGERMCGVKGERLAVIAIPNGLKIFDNFTLSRRGKETKWKKV